MVSAAVMVASFRPGTVAVPRRGPPLVLVGLGGGGLLRPGQRAAVGLSRNQVSRRRLAVEYARVDGAEPGERGANLVASRERVAADDVDGHQLGPGRVAGDPRIAGIAG